MFNNGNNLYASMNNQTQFDDGYTTINNGVLTTNYGIFNDDLNVNHNLIVGNDCSFNHNLSCTGISTLNNTSINGKLGIGTSSPNSIITAVLNGTSAPGENWNNDWIAIGNQGGTGSCVGIGYNNSTNTGHIACLAPAIAWRPLQITSQGVSFIANGGNFSFTGGNIGIGQSNPSYNLDVSGNSRFSNNLCVLGDTSLNEI